MRSLVGTALVTLPIAFGGDDSAPDFAREVQPVLSRNCFPCHGPDPEQREEGLRLDTREGALADRGGYKAVVPGDAGASELWLRVTDDLDPMPPASSGREIDDHDRELLRRWIESGAEYSPHWAFVRPTRSSPPELRDADWPRNPIDAFVLARLEAEGLQPAAEATRETLIRRLSLDLCGLPPSLEETDAFRRDAAPDAYKRLVERLLDSPGFGEHWASVWLDLARYADSAGHGSDPLRTIWRYRDWVIDALNDNMPFDQFTIEQLAGDLLPDAGVEQRLATAFHRNTMTNTEGGTDDEEFRVAAVKDRAITTAQVWTGLTMGCAQCHTHKFDPITHEEFYSFYAIFNQTADTDKNDDRPRLETPTAEQAVEEARLRGEIEALEALLVDPERDVSEELARWEAEERAREAAWVVLEPRELRSSDGATLRAHEDGSVLAEGESPARDTYTFIADAPIEGITALRLEVLPTDAGAPGRSPGNGNVVLNELRLASPAAAETPRARFVRVTNRGAQVILSLAEVEVWSAGNNLALMGLAVQSSTDYDGPPELAIDGNTNGRFNQGRSVTHTATEGDPWWELDLGEELAIEHLRIWNRTDGELETRLSDFTIELFDAQHAAVWNREIAEPPRPVLTIELRKGGGHALLRNATADFSDDDWSVALAIDGELSESTGWGLNPSLGGRHAAIFELESAPLEGPLVIELVQRFGMHHTLGRFRLSVTDLEPPVRVLDGALREALAKPAGERTEADRLALRRQFETVDPELARLRTGVTELEAEIDALGIVTTPVMVELPMDERRTTHLMKRGNFLDPGPAVEAGVPACLPPLPEGAPADRLALARWLTSPEHPLTARVTANRIWARLFGTGIVETEEDFGTQGAQPTHPRLLDWLGLELIDNGWDTKDLLRTIVQSATYRQASELRGDSAARDPLNRLYARGARFRLEAEEVRDVLLSISGLLSSEMHGPSVFPPQPDGMWQAAFNGERTWTESRGEDRWRRGIYVFLRRSSPYPSMATFDAPNREICALRRSRTNTPLQAFVTLNDPVYVEAAQALARRLVREGGESTAERAAYAQRLALGREPGEELVTVLVELFDAALADYSEDPEAALALATEPLGPLPADMNAAELGAWTLVANVVLNQDAVLVKD